ncbi:unnamed protein product [Prorocentrum cordatum]|uniref:Uncharacterized protein n=1 Tax=Prorocentrum cordatum TaxID=2364126 RepID=A0ABN9SZG9_9DINO|nr:unnamed protein product [Polarella glacialis]
MTVPVGPWYDAVADPDFFEHFGRQRGVLLEIPCYDDQRIEQGTMIVELTSVSVASSQGRWLEAKGVATSDPYYDWCVLDAPAGTRPPEPQAIHFGRGGPNHCASMKTGHDYAAHFSKARVVSIEGLTRGAIPWAAKSPAAEQVETDLAGKGSGGRPALPPSGFPAGADGDELFDVDDVGVPLADGRGDRGDPGGEGMQDRLAVLARDLLEGGGQRRGRSRARRSQEEPTGREERPRQCLFGQGGAVEIGSPLVRPAVHRLQPREIVGTLPPSGEIRRPRPGHGAGSAVAVLARVVVTGDPLVSAEAVFSSSLRSRLRGRRRWARSGSRSYFRDAPPSCSWSKQLQLVAYAQRYLGRLAARLLLKMGAIVSKGGGAMCASLG